MFCKCSYIHAPQGSQVDRIPKILFECSPNYTTHASTKQLYDVLSLDYVQQLMSIRAKVTNNFMEAPGGCRCCEQKAILLTKLIEL